MDKQQLQQALEQLGPEHPYMSDEQISIFRQHLLHNLQTQEDALKEARAQYQSIELGSTDPLDVATATEEQERMLRRISTLNTQIANTRQSLKDMNNDEYGYCVDCGIEIGLGRLIQAPFSRRDHDCATMFEQKNRRDTAGISM